MELTVLAVPGLAEALAGYPPVPVARQMITDAAGAAARGMHGSPTLLVNGEDPFAAPGTPTALACRLYRDEDRSLHGAPSVPALRRALKHARDHG